MRWFIVFLIVANVILYFWVQQQSKPLPGSTRLPPPDIGQLVLVNEVDEEPPGSAANGPEPVPRPGGQDTLTAAVPIEVEPDATDRVEAVVLAPESEAPVKPSAKIALPETDPEPQTGELGAYRVAPVVEQPANVAIDADERADALIVAADQSVAQAQQAAADTEEGEAVASQSAADPGEPAPAAVAEPVVAEVEPVCAQAGPFASDDANTLIAALPANISLLSDVTREHASVDRYYVLIPPLPSRAAGRQKLKELAQAGVTDTWLFPSGEYRNAISLGYFSREAGARRHAANVAKKGFTTEVREKTSIRQRRWLVLMNSEGGDLGSSLPFPAATKVEQMACP